jgi:hypothetical protein
MKWSPECEVIKLFSWLPSNRSQRSGRGTYCKPCHNRIVSENKDEACAWSSVFNCNGALGQFRDHTDLMMNAVAYLEPELFGQLQAAGATLGMHVYIGHVYIGPLPERAGEPGDAA